MARFRTAGWIWVGLVVLGGCGGGRDADPPTAAAAPATRPSGAASAPSPTAAAPYIGPQSVAGSFELVGGYRLQADFASEGLALVKDADGTVVEAIAGANSHTGKLNVYDLRGSSGAGADANAYPILQPLRQSSIAALFPNEVGQGKR